MKHTIGKRNINRQILYIQHMIGHLSL